MSWKPGESTSASATEALNNIILLALAPTLLGLKADADIVNGTALSNMMDVLNLGGWWKVQRNNDGDSALVSDVLIRLQHGDMSDQETEAAAFILSDFFQAQAGVYGYANAVTHAAGQDLPGQPSGVAASWAATLAVMNRYLATALEELPGAVTELEGLIAQLAGIDLKAINDLIGAPSIPISDMLEKAGVIQVGPGTGTAVSEVLAGVVQTINGSDYNVLNDLMVEVSGALYSMGELAQTMLYYDSGGQLRNALFTLRSQVVRRDVQPP